jgi:hypothetical protein
MSVSAQYATSGPRATSSPRLTRHPVSHPDKASDLTRRAYRVRGQGRATIGGQICLRNPAVGAGAAIRGKGGQSARRISRGVAGDPRLRGERKPTCSPLVTSFASAISYGKFARGAGWWSGSERVAGGWRGRSEQGAGPLSRGRLTRAGAPLSQTEEAVRTSGASSQITFRSLCYTFGTHRADCRFASNASCEFHPHIWTSRRGRGWRLCPHPP